MSRIEQEQEGSSDSPLQIAEELMEKLNINSDAMLEIAYTYEQENQLLVFDKIEIKISQAIKGYYEIYKYDYKGSQTVIITPDWRIEKMIVIHLGRPNVRITLCRFNS